VVIITTTTTTSFEVRFRCRRRRASSRTPARCSTPTCSSRRNGTLKASPPGPQRFLTIAMATFDEYDATFLSGQSVRMYPLEIADETAILVLDNHRSGPCAPALRFLDEKVKEYRCFPYRFTVKDLLFREATSEFVVVMDAHVLFAPGGVAKIVARPMDIQDV
jgi:hypothetical protein